MENNSLEIKGFKGMDDIRLTGWRAVVGAILIGWAVPISIGVGIGWMLPR